MSAEARSIRVDALRAMVATLFAFALLLALGTSARAAEIQNHPFKTTLIGGLDKSEPPKSQLESPCGVAVRPAGEIWVSDYYRRTIFGGPALPEYFAENGPCGLASDPFNVYVNYRHGGVANVATGVIDPAPATGIAVDATSFDLYVNHRSSIAIYSAPVDPGDPPTGEIDPGSTGALTDGYGLAVSSFPGTAGYVYVADAFDNVVEVYNPKVSTTTPIQEIDGGGTAAGRFVSLKDSSLAVDPANGDLFVADNTQPGFEHPLAVVSEFNPEGLYRGQLEHKIVDALPVGLAIDESATATNGQVYVTSGNSSSNVLPDATGPPVSEQGALYSFGFAGAGQTLAVTLSGSGAGSVQSSSPGIACPGSCKAEFNSGKNVTLSATPEAGSAFAGWSGSGCSGSESCQVSLAAAATVDAEFVPAPIALAADSATVAETSTAATRTPDLSGETSTPAAGKAKPASRGRCRKKNKARRRPACSHHAGKSGNTPR